MAKAKKIADGQVDEYSLGDALLESLQEIRDWKAGKLAVEVVHIAPMLASEVKAIRKRAAKSVKAFEAKFGIPAATINNWEQGRRDPDIAARLLLRVIDDAPDVVERAAKR
jgi:putative transcriptional regulator